MALKVQEWAQNKHLTDLIEEVIVDFMTEHEELYNRNQEPRQGRNAFGRGSPIAVSYLCMCARHGLNPKVLTTANSHTPSLGRLQKK